MLVTVDVDESEVLADLSDEDLQAEVNARRQRAGSVIHDTHETLRECVTWLRRSHIDPPPGLRAMLCEATGLIL